MCFRTVFSSPGYRELGFRLTLLLLLITLPATAKATDWLTNNTRATLDFSSRVIESGGETWTLHAVGLDLHKVFSSSRGDIGVLTFQPYLVRIDGAPTVPPIFDDGDDWALQWRIANFNYTGLGRGRFNVRLGHFELPVGLEQVVQTNGTLYQVPVIGGLKADWGVSINGVLPWFEYEIARTQGSGNSLSSDADGLVVGRIGLPQQRLWWAGLSALEGEVERGPGFVDQRRFAIDGGIRLPRGFSLLLQHARGEEGAADVVFDYLETSWTTPRETTFVYAQWRSERRDLDVERQRRRDFHLGLRFEPNAHFSASVEARRHLDAERDYSGALQLRFRL